jgi:antirestriction protein ArdC
MYYDSPYFLTQKQIELLGGTVKEGEKPEQVVFWKWLQVPGGKPGAKDKFVPMMRLYDVFNLTQVEGLKARKHRNGTVDEVTIPVPDASDDRHLKACEHILETMTEKPVIKQGKNRACYSPVMDEIGMPYKSKFPKVEEFYSTLFHELTHWTGHESRLKRKTLVDMAGFGTSNYSKEELVAEFGASFLCGITGISNVTVENSASYIASWRKKLEDDPSLLVKAASIAQKAVDYITEGSKPKVEPKPKKDKKAPDVKKEKKVAAPKKAKASASHKEKEA